MARRKKKVAPADSGATLIILAITGFLMSSGYAKKPSDQALCLGSSFLMLAVGILVVIAERRKRKQEDFQAIPISSRFPPNTNFFEPSPVDFYDSYSLSPTQFEKRVAWVLEQLRPSIMARVVGGSGDGGVDIKIIDREKKTLVAVVQVKRYSPDTYLQPTHLRDLLQTMRDHNVAAGMMVTTARFSAGSEKYAANRGVTLVDGRKFSTYYAQAHRRAHQIERPIIIYDEPAAPYSDLAKEMKERRAAQSAYEDDQDRPRPTYNLPKDGNRINIYGEIIPDETRRK